MSLLRLAAKVLYKKMCFAARPPISSHSSSTIASPGGWLSCCFWAQQLCFTVETFSLVTRAKMQLKLMSQRCRGWGKHAWRRALVWGLYLFISGSGTVQWTMLFKRGCYMTGSRLPLSSKGAVTWPVGRELGFSPRCNAACLTNYKKRGRAAQRLTLSCTPAKHHKNYFTLSCWQNPTEISTPNISCWQTSSTLLSHLNCFYDGLLREEDFS